MFFVLPKKFLSNQKNSKKKNNPIKNLSKNVMKKIHWKKLLTKKIATDKFSWRKRLKIIPTKQVYYSDQENFNKQKNEDFFPLSIKQFFPPKIVFTKILFYQQNFPTKESFKDII